ncbi:MAG: YcgN family cysteine cluster protein [Marinicaulis sp.]|nr:YcgN family cysteine cluster protein [Marinicaulis sp.]NNC37807.1 YcgN family cysteine cluster protein [Hyphomonadaceae bacterium]
MNLPFWKSKSMADMTDQEWESLCDGCGKCCCLRMEDEDTGAIYVTDITCKLFDRDTCRCGDYTNRVKKVPDCVQLTPENAGALAWMPQTCAYRLIANGKDLFDWHHLVSGSHDSIHDAGMSVQNATYNEIDIPEKEHVNHIVIWPGEPDVSPD